MAIFKTMNDTLNEREFELVNIVGAQLAANQRDLSRQLNMSLGMTNMLLRRLVTKGYIRIKQLNRRKVEYILTSKGFTEKMRKSVKYTIKTLNSIGLIKKRLEILLGSLHASGIRKFYILGSEDLASLIEMVLSEKFHGLYEIHRIATMIETKKDEAVLVCEEGIECPENSGGSCVNLIYELSCDGTEISKVLKGDQA